LALEPALRLVSCVRATTSRKELEEIMAHCFFIARAAKVDDDGRRMLEDVGGVAG
jgi:hypothetical protein